MTHNTRPPKPDRRKLAARKPHHHRTPTEQAMKVSEQEEKRLREQMAAWGIGIEQRGKESRNG